jgi:hypothetical protein
LRQDPGQEWITHASVYRIRMPLERALVREIERHNGRLIAERISAQAAGRWPYTQPGGHRERQLELAIT